MVRKKVIDWSPDTCGCKVQYWFDMELSPSPLHYESIVSVCSQHAGLLGTELYNKIVDENDRKNILEGVAIVQFAVPQGDYKWSYDSNRVLHVKLTVPASTKLAIQQYCDTRFGADKVIIE